MILDVDFDSCNDLVRLVTVCCCKFGQSPCMTCMVVRNTSNTQCNMTCFEMLLDVHAWKILRCIPHHTKSKKYWHAQFCCTTRGIDPYVIACTTQLYMCQGTRYPICGYQSSNGMLQDSEFQVLVKLKDWVTDVEKLFTQSEIEG